MIATNQDLGALLLSLARNKYPSNLFDPIYVDLPISIKEVFKYCKFLSVSDPWIAPAVRKLSSAPITDINYSTSSTQVKERYRELFETQLKMRSVLRNISISDEVYGNAVVSAYVVPDRYVVCPVCEKAGRKRRYRLEDIDFKIKREEIVGKCPQCRQNVTFKRVDRNYKNIKNLKIVIWNPLQIDVEHYSLLGENDYYYTPGKADRVRILSGDKKYISKLPWEFIKAVINGKRIKLNEAGLFHFYTASIPGVFDGWGIPKIMATLKLIFYIYTLMKANQATANGKMNDLTVLFPAGVNGNSAVGGVSPIDAIGGIGWKNEVERILKEWRKDPNYVGVTGFPIGSASMFGNGRQMLITGELQFITRIILGALNMSEDMLYANSNYSSMAVSIRMLANLIGESRIKMNEFLQFIASIANGMSPQRYPKISVTLSPYKTVDDLQETSMLIGLANERKVSWGTVLRRFRLDPEEEMANIKSEIGKYGDIEKASGKWTAITQAIAMNIQREYENLFAIEQQRKQMNEGGNGTIDRIVQNLMAIYERDPKLANQKLQEIQAQSPELYNYIVDAFKGVGNEQLVEGKEEGPDRIRPPRKL